MSPCIPVFETDNIIFLHFFYRELSDIVDGLIFDVFLESGSNKIPFAQLKETIDREEMLDSFKWQNIFIQ
jgi:hypothetical protein